VRKRFLTALVAMPALLFPATSTAAGYSFPIDIRAELLAISLRDLARQTGIELLFDRIDLGERRAPAVRGRLTAEAALQRLLASSGFAMRRTASHAWVVEREMAGGAAPSEEVAAPEILVVGRRSQDLDIRRRENDIQPYQVATGEEVTHAHRDDVDQFFRSRVAANTAVLPKKAVSLAGQTNSEIDLRGLGPAQTLILTDGRRLPAFPSQDLALQQPDLNAIPLHAIDRIETLTGTAGGIYGFGALGGVVNVVLRRDLHGLELHGTSGISEHGDGRRLSLEGGLGFSPDGGATSVMLYVGGNWEQPLLMGRRGYELRGREQVDRAAPDVAAPSLVTADAIQVRDSSGRALVFKPEFGGLSLGASRTYLPNGFAGSPADLVASLTEHAGGLDLSPSKGVKDSYMASAARTASALLNVRRRFAGGAEAYLDMLILHDRGRDAYRVNSDALTLSGTSPFNPFQNDVQIGFTTPPTERTYRSSYDSERYTAGLIVPLPMQWKALMEASFGTADYFQRGATPFFGPSSGIADPFGDWQTFQRSMVGRYLSGSKELRVRNRYRDTLLRLAGPLFHTAAGPAGLTMLIEQRRERIPQFNSATFSPLSSTPLIADYAGRASSTRSASAELATPLIAEDARVPIVRGLQLQLALRRDAQANSFLPDLIVSSTGVSERLHARFSATTFLGGAKFFPTKWLMLRGSYATGRQAPPLQSLVEHTYTTPFLFGTDPRRGNGPIATGQLVTMQISGFPDLEMVRASTLALGMVLNPRGDGGPRISFDYSRIRRSGDPYQPDSVSFILGHEDFWPNRVRREPLTDADRARGYTGGRVIAIDQRAGNLGRLYVDSVDARFSWVTPLAGGSLKTQGTATLQLRNDRQSPFWPADRRVGYLDGPLRLRANMGLDWTYRRTTFGGAVQYFSHYRNYYFLSPNANSRAAQGSEFIAAQAYVDLSLRQRLSAQWAGRQRGLSLDLGLVNVLNRRPPYDFSGGIGGGLFSWYSDPRGRRLELSLNAAF
jgi:iron complex outermembrane receptor protein